MGSGSSLTGLIAYRPLKTPVFGRSVACRSISEADLVFSRYASNSARCSSVTSSAAREASGATTKKVAPYRVSGRVVKTRTGSSRPSTRKSTHAPDDRPIQLRCMASTRSGHLPSSGSMSSSSR